MASIEVRAPGKEKSKEYWVDVEVPHTKIQNKWEKKYRGKLNNHMRNNRLQKRVLSIYYKIVGISDVPRKREKALDTIKDANPELAYNLCSQFEFSDGVSRRTIEKFAEDLRDDIVDAGFEEEYKKNAGEKEGTAPNKDGLVALCQLVEPDSLRDMLVYHRASRRYPNNSYKREGSGGVPDESDWDELLNHMTNVESVDYEVWHQFEFEDARYVAIEKEDRDGVERQVGNNIEEEPANLIILEFEEEYLDIYADAKSTADSVQNGVNSDLSDVNYEEDRNEVDTKTVADFTKKLSEKDRKRDSTESDEDYDYVMTELWVDSTQLTHNPAIKISAAEGIGKAISELDEFGVDLLADTSNISKVKIQYEGWKFTVSNVRRSTTDDETYRELVYGTEAPPETRREFETLIDEEFGIGLNYKSSAA